MLGRFRSAIYSAICPTDVEPGASVRGVAGSGDSGWRNGTLSRDADNTIIFGAIRKVIEIPCNADPSMPGKTGHRRLLIALL